MLEISCFCGNNKDVTVIYEQNFAENMLTSVNFSARGKHDLDTEHWHYRILRCKKCLQLFSSPILEREKIENFYRKTKLYYADETENIVNSYLNPLLKREYLLIDRETIMEVGCGNGVFLDAVKKIGFKQLIGIEPSIHAVAEAKEDIRPFIRNTSFERITIDINSVDLICAFQVLDHFVNPVEVMERFIKILKSGGLCYAIVHNEQALHIKILKDKSPSIDVSHIYYFNKKTLKRLFEKVGFKVIDIFPIWNSYMMKTWLRISPLPFKNAVLKLSRMLKTENITISIPAGNIGIIGKKR